MCALSLRTAGGANEERAVTLVENAMNEEELKYTKDIQGLLAGITKVLRLGSLLLRVEDLQVRESEDLIDDMVAGEAQDGRQPPPTPANQNTITLWTAHISGTRNEGSH